MIGVNYNLRLTVAFLEKFSQFKFFAAAAAGAPAPRLGRRLAIWGSGPARGPPPRRLQKLKIGKIGARASGRLDDSNVDTDPEDVHIYLSPSCKVAFFSPGLF